MATEELHKNLYLRKWANAADDLCTEDGLKALRVPHKGDYPLLMACERRAPESLILTMIRKYPEAASMPSKTKYLPLHHACQLRLSTDIILALIEAYPEGLDVENNMQITPRFYRQTCEEAAELINKPTLCWKKKSQDDILYQQQLEKVASLREQKWKLRNILKQYKHELIPLRDMVDDIEILANSMRLHKDRLLEIDHELQKIETKTSIKLIMFRAAVAKAENSIDDKNLLQNSRREDCFERRQYTENSVRSVQELQRDIDTIKNNLRQKEVMSVI